MSLTKVSYSMITGAPVNLLDYGAVGDGTTNDTTALQAAVTAAANANLTLLIPDGTYLYTNITVPSGRAISLMGASKANAILKQSNASTSSSPGITSTGSFFAENLTFDQNWLTSYSVGPLYNDGADPNTWGGYFIASISATPSLTATSPTVNIQNCNVLNATRGFLVTGAVSVDFFNNYSNTLNASTATQSIIAMSQCQQVSCMANTLVTAKWSSNTTLPAYYGLSGIYTWGCTNVEVANNTFVGFQLVTRGGNATFTASVSGTTMTVSAIASGTLVPGMVISGTNVFSDNTILAQLSGTTGGVGTYQLSFSNTGSLPVTALAARCIVSNNIIDTPIADTAAFFWKYVIFSDNIIRMSGDMGITYDSAQYVTITGNVINGTQIGGIGGVATFPVVSLAVTGNVIKDIAQGTNGPYAVVELISGRRASNGGAFLSAIAFFYSFGGTGNAALTVTGNSITFENLPPVSDGGGAVRAIVNGLYFEQSSNPAATYTGAITGNFVENRQADLPLLFVNAASHYFTLNGAFTGSPAAGEVFTNGANTFVFLSGFPPAGLCYIKKLVGTVGGAATFTGTSGATITTAASPGLTFLNVTGAANNDFTTTYANQNLGV
jgi:hypothetical protein